MLKEHPCHVCKIECVSSMAVEVTLLVFLLHSFRQPYLIHYWHQRTPSKPYDSVKEGS